MSYNDKFVTPEIIEAHLDKPWDWSVLTENKKFTIEYIESHIDFPWSWKDLCRNDNLTADFFKRYFQSKYNLQVYCFDSFDEKPNLINETMKLIKEIPNLEVRWWDASRTFPIQFIEESTPSLGLECHIKKSKSYRSLYRKSNVGIVTRDWYWECLSINPVVTDVFCRETSGRILQMGLERVVDKSEHHL